MSTEDGSDNPTSHDAKAKQLVEYARRQARPALQLRRENRTHGLPQDVFPGYTVVANVSRGGQGRVYEAIENTTQRRVAIKVLRSGPFSGDVERFRFEREIQVLAQLQHPHIVAIHSSGTAALQRYYVMDFIAGQPLDDYARNNTLSVEQTLTLFSSICEAVNAAHLRGIVHRDLKPSNIRVDDQGEPHVLDFGLAKPLPDSAGASPDSLEATAAGQFVGSLPWAAPEQVINAPETIDLRTDVYALGLLLYHMLTGSFPYNRRSSARDMMESILHSAPRPPRLLRREIDDELSTIILMCLQKDPARRYQSAGDLARDIQRYRAGEPIEAKRDSAGYLLAKTIRRYRGLATMAGAFVLVSFGYAVTMSVLYQRAAESEKLAEERAAEVSEQFAITREAIGYLVDEVSTRLNQAPGHSRVRHDILEGAFERLLPLLERHGDDPLLLEDLMRTHYQLGDIAIALARYDTAATHLQQALELRLRSPAARRESPEAQAELSIHYVLLGDVAKHRGDPLTCEQFYRQALAIDEQLAAEHPEDAHFQDNLAWSYDRLSALVHASVGPLAAKEYALKQLDIMEGLVSSDPDNAIRLHGLCAAHKRLLRIAGTMGDAAAHVHHAERSLEISTRAVAAAPNDPYILWDHIFTVSSHYGRTIGLTAQERVDGILGTREFVERLLSLSPDVPRNRYAQIVASFRLMDAASRTGDQTLSVNAAHEVIDGAEAYAELAPVDYDIASRHVNALQHLRSVSESRGDVAASHELHRRACRVYEQALTTGVDRLSMEVALLQLRLENPDPDAVQRSDILAEADRILLDVAPGDAGSLVQLGIVFAKVGECGVAVDLLERAENLLLPRGATLPDYADRIHEECGPAARE